MPKIIGKETSSLNNRYVDRDSSYDEILPDSNVLSSFLYSHVESVYAVTTLMRQFSAVFTVAGKFNPIQNLQNLTTYTIKKFYHIQ